MKKKIVSIIKLLLYAFLAIIGFFMIVVSLIFIFDYHINYVKVDATIVKYKNGGENLSLSSKEHWSIMGEELVLGYKYDDKYYETFYYVLISNDYNYFDVGSTTKIKVNPKNPHEIIWKLDKTPYIYSFFGFCFIILFFRKLKSRKNNEYLNN